MTRRGMTIVELVVMSAVAAVVLATVYLLFSAGSRHGNRMDEKLRGVQAAQILLEYLTADLKAALVNASRQVRVESIAEGSRNRLSFDRYDGERSRHHFGGYLPVKHCVYQFEQKTHKVLRDGEPMPVGSFASVSFVLTHAQPDASPALLGETVTVLMTTAPIEQLERGEVDARSSSTFVATIAYPSISPLDPLHTWLPNYYGSP
ncbi:MAG: hypothetical protein HY303_21485 [Candidatus Wallbacteria bacterium]|nr:hypothetical protein [Candidatus Wallbacteria bacterium]